MNGQAGETLKTGWRPSVLLVDDQPGKLLSYAAVLEQIDATLVMASSAREALEHLLRGEFAVVVVDVCMPELDGFELVATIRDHPRFQRTAIIFVSGVHLTELDRLRGYEHGAVDYLPVPIVPEILRAKVGVFVDLFRKTRELEQLNAELEQRVQARTMELERASKQKDDFLAVLAHELRNPLAAIRSAAHVLTLENTPADMMTRSVAVIERQVVHLARLIDDLVDVSRITQGKVELRQEPVAVADFLAHAIEASRPLVDARSHDLVLDIPSDPLIVHGDVTRLAQVVTNILNNAAKFTNPGGRIQISAAREDGEAVICVRDNGVGITPAMLCHVFELFTQVTPPLNRAHSGLGIGLALVRRLVELHGGQVSATSEGIGCGTTVTVRLPCVMPADTEAAPTDDAESVRLRAPASRVLVADDNADAADVLAILLRASGHEVLTAEDGVEALRVGQAFGPDVVLLDLGMPRLNGYETAREIRQQPWGRDVGLIAVTGWGDTRDYDNTRHAGFDAHLVKPADQSELLRIIGRVATMAAERRQESRTG